LENNSDHENIIEGAEFNAKDFHGKELLELSYTL